MASKSLSLMRKDRIEIIRCIVVYIYVCGFHFFFLKKFSPILYSSSPRLSHHCSLILTRFAEYIPTLNSNPHTHIQGLHRYFSGLCACAVMLLCCMFFVFFLPTSYTHSNSSPLFFFFISSFFSLLSFVSSRIEVPSPSW
jgi:hypothetical protein